MPPRPGTLVARRPGVVVASLATARTPQHRELAGADAVGPGHRRRGPRAEERPHPVACAGRPPDLALSPPPDRDADRERRRGAVQPGQPAASGSPGRAPRVRPPLRRAAAAAPPRRPGATCARCSSEVMVRNTRALSGVRLPPRFARTVLVEPLAGRGRALRPPARRAARARSRRAHPHAALDPAAGGRQQSGRAGARRCAASADPRRARTPAARDALAPAIACAERLPETGKARGAAARPRRRRRHGDRLHALSRHAGVSRRPPRPPRDRLRARRRRHRRCRCATRPSSGRASSRGVLLSTDVGSEGLNLQFCHRAGQLRPAVEPDAHRTAHRPPAPHRPGASGRGRQPVSGGLDRGAHPAHPRRAHQPLRAGRRRGGDDPRLPRRRGRLPGAHVRRLRRPRRGAAASARSNASPTGWPRRARATRTSRRSTRRSSATSSECDVDLVREFVAASLDAVGAVVDASDACRSRAASRQVRRRRWHLSGGGAHHVRGRRQRRKRDDGRRTARLAAGRPADGAPPGCTAVRRGRLAAAAAASLTRPSSRCCSTPCVSGDVRQVPSRLPLSRRHPQAGPAQRRGAQRDRYRSPCVWPTAPSVPSLPLAGGEPRALSPAGRRANGGVQRRRCSAGSPARASGASRGALEAIERRVRRDLEHMAEFYASLDQEMAAAARRARGADERARQAGQTCGAPRRSDGAPHPAARAHAAPPVRRVGRRDARPKPTPSASTCRSAGARARASSRSLGRGADSSFEGPMCARCGVATLRHLSLRRPPARPLRRVRPRGRLDAARCPACRRGRRRRRRGCPSTTRPSRSGVGWRARETAYRSSPIAYRLSLSPEPGQSFKCAFDGRQAESDRRYAICDQRSAIGAIRSARAAPGARGGTSGRRRRTRSTSRA